MPGQLILITYVALNRTVRRICPIVLIAVLLFNVLGYYFVFLELRFYANRSLTNRLDSQQYSDAETFIVKMPLAIPYRINDDDYSRIDGETEHNGEFYRLVKQKYADDTLYVVCLKDEESKKINNALTDYVQTFTDKSSDSKQNVKPFNFIKYFFPTSICINALTAGWSSSIVFEWKQEVEQLFYQTIITPPPQG